MIAREARVLRLQALEAPREEPRAAEQNHRQRHL
jgi:hypothetical protein